MEGSAADQIKEMRATLKLNQHQFAALIGLSPMTVCRWENGLTEPRELGAVILELLSNALRYHAPRVLLDALRQAAPDPAHLVRVPARLEDPRWHPPVPPNTPSSP